MLRPAVAIALAAALFSGCASAPESPNGAAPPDGPGLEPVIDAVKAALVEAESSETPGLPPLKSVTVKLQTTAVRGAGGELRVIVFSAGGTISKEAASTIEIELGPPEHGTRRLLPAELKDTLARAIVAARAGAAHAARGDPPLSVKSVRVDVRFSVSVGGSAAGSIQLVPAGLDLSGKISRENVHTVSLVFGR